MNRLTYDRAALTLPLVVPVAAPIGVLAMLGTSPGDRLDMLLFFVGSSLVLGYGYVLPIELLRRVGERRGWLER